MPLLDQRGDVVAGAEPVFAELKRKQKELLAQLPTHAEHLRRLHGR